jgi:hypothetical protein
MVIATKEKYGKSNETMLVPQASLGLEELHQKSLTPIFLENSRLSFALRSGFCVYRPSVNLRFKTGGGWVVATRKLPG